MTRQLIKYGRIRILGVAVTVSVCLAAMGDTWREVGKNDVRFARGLADTHVKFGPDLLTLVDETVQACQPVPSKFTGHTDLEIREIALFCKYSCRPWHDAWADALAPCEDPRPPNWCRDVRRAGEHLQIGPYFEVLTGALHDIEDSVARYNIMSVIAARLEEKVIQDYPRHEIDAWVAAATSEYLHSAGGEDVVAIGQQLSFMSFGKRSAVAREFSNYAQAAEHLTTEQRQQLGRVIDELREKPDE